MPNKSTYPISEDDIRLLMEQMAKMHEEFAKMKQMENRLEDKIVDKIGKKLEKELHATEERIKQENKDYYNFYTGKTYKDLRGATEDEMQMLKDKEENHEIRISALEQKAEYATAA